MTNDDVLKLKSAGLSDELRISNIRSAPATFHLDTGDLINLKKANISDMVIGAMSEAQGKSR